MRILKSLLGSKSNYDALGNTDPICPYCSKALDKMPGRKKKCPNCSNYIYVRTRPSDRKKVIVIEQDAIKIDEQWMIKNGTYETYLENKKEFDIQRESLTKKWGKIPSDRDVHWALYNKKLIKHAQEGNWGLYRNTRFSMAELLKGEKRHRPALDTYLEVAYLDANGPSNTGGILDPQIAREYPPFSRDMAFQAPGVVHRIQKLAESLGMNESELEQAFMGAAERLHKSMKLPTSVDQGWDDLRNELRKGK